MTVESEKLYSVGALVGHKNGLVIQPMQSYGESKVMRSFWVSCPQDGPQPPFLKERELYPGKTDSYIATKARLPERWERVPAMALCSVCETDGPLRNAIIPIERSGSHERCTRKCFEGKTTCHCGCRGRCHGEKACYCEVAK
jgi:hypothetical protein